MEDELWVDPRLVARVTMYIWSARRQLVYRNAIYGSPALPSGVIVPSLTQTECRLSSKCASAWPFPPRPPWCSRPQPSAPQVRQSQRFSLRSHFEQCANPSPTKHCPPSRYQFVAEIGRKGLTHRTRESGPWWVGKA
jgi:hypothetical protein